MYHGRYEFDIKDVFVFVLAYWTEKGECVCVCGGGEPSIDSHRPVD